MKYPPIQIEKTYPPEIEEVRAMLQAGLVDHLAQARARAMRAPSWARWQIIENAERAVRPIREELMRIECEHARLTVLVPADSEDEFSIMAAALRRAARKSEER